MASQTTIHRAVAAGLSAGVCMALPMAGYAVAGAVDGVVQDLVSASAVPFVVGAAAGIGLVSISAAVLDYTSERDEEPASFFAENTEAERPRAHAASSRGGLFSREGAPAGVPVIARAQDALSEEEAWADIDATFAGDSPFSCDPASSKDIYQIALEELSRASAPRRQDPSVTAQQSAYASAEASLASTAVMAGINVPAPSQATSVFLAAAAAQAAETARERGRDADAAQAALASLGAPTPMKGVPASVAERIDVVKPQAATAAPVAAPSPEKQASDPAPAAYHAAHMAEPASFKGHEDMWAAALAILDEKPAAPAPALTPERAQAVAEGKRETELHGHVNRIVSEELDRVRSKSVRRSSKEFLRVIQGGTMSMPALSAEA